jgi:hypothetical protein
MVRIAAHAESRQLGIDARATRAGMLELLEHHGTATIAQHETVPITIPWAGRTLRRIVAGRKRLGLAEAPDTGRRRGHFGAAGHDQIGIAVLNRAHAQTDRMRRGGTGGDDSEIRPSQAIADR